MRFDLRMLVKPWLLVVGLFLIGVPYVIVSRGDWVWEVQISPRQGAIRLLIPRETSRIDLELGSSEQAAVLLAETTGAVKEWWTYRHLDGASAGTLHPCEASSGSAPPGASPPCERRGALIGILPSALPTASRPPGRPAEEAQREIFLLFHESERAATISLENIPAVATLRRVALNFSTGGSVGLAARECVSPDPTAKSGCHMIDGLLGRPRLINQRDPQPLIVALARWANSLLVPALVLSMLILDGLLLLILVLCLCYPGKRFYVYSIRNAPALLLILSVISVIPAKAGHHHEIAAAPFVTVL